ncbi:FitA-like ribbon-helix-helix domain-containing protein [Herbiconiux sp. KACC 21604]|uniref:FitA-like ribbon-helix-helix domain-containing protein n=2 Tax=unclassified Herbiconiux TaxID=2618217 RepID=UPI00388E1951
MGPLPATDGGAHPLTELRERERAAAHRRSMESEVRAILTEAVAEAGLVRAWLALASEVRSVGRVSGDDEELVLPARSAPRRIDFS